MPVSSPTPNPSDDASRLRGTPPIIEVRRLLAQFRQARFEAELRQPSRGTRRPVAQYMDAAAKITPDDR